MLSLSRKQIPSAVGLALSLMLLNPWGAVSLATDRPDFVVTSVGDPPPTALPGDSFAVDVTVTNQGPAAAEATASLTQIVTKFYLVMPLGCGELGKSACTTKKNLKGVQTIHLPVAKGEDPPSPSSIT